MYRAAEAEAKVEVLLKYRCEEEVEVCPPCQWEEEEWPPCKWEEEEWPPHQWEEEECPPCLWEEEVQHKHWEEQVEVEVGGKVVQFQNIKAGFIVDVENVIDHIYIDLHVVFWFQEI